MHKKRGHKKGRFAAVPKPDLMNKYSSFYDTVDQIVSYGIEKGILHLFTGEEAFDGTTIVLGGKNVINFGSCSYLGLEFDPRLKQAAKNAIDRYGTQFSESRAYVSLSLYKHLQLLLERIFNAPCIVAPTTTLAHIANIPVMAEHHHAIIMDQQVHNSVQTAVQIVKARGVHVELVRHNRVDLLEDKIIGLKDKYSKIWYMADGVYSMFGDAFPVKEILALMDKYPSLHCYVDDAHGMSVYGKNGCGYVLSFGPIHPRMVIATSLNKAFASGGGVLVYGDKELARKVSRVGGPLLSSGPMQPSALGAAIAAAEIHLSDEIEIMQQQLRRNIEYTHLILEEKKLPVISKSGAAIFFIGVSYPKLGHNLVRRMLNKGFYLNLGIFPTVPIRQTGIRFTITRLHSFPEIERMIETLAQEFNEALVGEGVSLSEINRAFKRTETLAETLDTGNRLAPSKLQIESFDSIIKINASVWDNIFRHKGAFDWKALQLLEQAFKHNTEPEENWDFDYLLVKDEYHNIVAATFLTTAIWKDDMLNDKRISASIEKERSNDKYALTSRVLATGSLITEGEHFFLNSEHSLWQEAAGLLIEKIYGLKKLRMADHVMIRDFRKLTPVLDSFMVDNGFFRVTLPPTNIIEDVNWKSADELYNKLSKNAKTQVRKKVIRNMHLFETTVLSGKTKKVDLDHVYELYLAVKNSSLELNTFALPIKYFKAILENDDWEIIQLTIRDHQRPCCYIMCHGSGKSYNPMVIGLDYEFNTEYNIYRQALYQVMLRAAAYGAGTIHFGFSADVEKQKLGAVPYPTFAYMHTDDTYNMERMSLFSQVNSN